MTGGVVLRSRICCAEDQAGLVPYPNTTVVITREHQLIHTWAELSLSYMGLSCPVFLWKLSENAEPEDSWASPQENATTTISPTGSGALVPLLGCSWEVTGHREAHLSGGQGSWTTEEAHSTAQALRESRCMHCSGTTSRTSSSVHTLHWSGWEWGEQRDV